MRRKARGVVIWVASCKEGLGSKTFSDWISEAEKPEDLIERVGRDFQLGGHKAAAIAVALRKSSILMVSDLQDDVVRSFFAEPVESLDKAVEKALSMAGTSAKVIVMPAGGSTLRFSGELKQNIPGTEREAILSGLPPCHHPVEHLFITP